MSWLRGGSDERLIRAMRTRREVNRGPLPREGTPYVDEALAPARTVAHTFSFSTFFVIVLVVVLIAATFYYARYSGALRWLILAAVVAALGFVAMRAVRGFVRDPYRLDARPLASPGVGGEVRSLRTTLQRADGGLGYSQVVFEDRLRKAFLKKVRANRALPATAIEARVKDPERLHEIVGDRELTVFVLESARNARRYPASMPALPKRRGFARRIARLLDRMEAWR